MIVNLTEQETILVGSYLNSHKMTEQDLLYCALMEKLENEKIYGPFDTVEELMESLNAEE